MLARDLRPMEILQTDPKNDFPLFGSVRVMVLSFPAVARLQKDLIKSLGLDKTSVIFTRFGYETGMGLATAIAGLYDFDSYEEWMRAGGVLFNSSGVARVTFDEIKIDRNRNYLNVSGCWHGSIEVLGWLSNEDHASRPICSLISGMVSGFASAVLGTEALARETSCRAAGHKECRFVCKSLNEWGLEPESVRNQLKVPPVDEEIARMRRFIREAREAMARQNAEIASLKRRNYEQGAAQGIITRSDSMTQVLRLADKVAPTNSTVLILGESGTGKELLSRYIHSLSGRKEEPFLAINCAALPPNLLESELFGHKKGSFTGADSDKVGLFVEAGNGTIFLDEVGEMPLELQAKLLRALQEKEVRPVGDNQFISINARILTATNRDLREMVAEGKFREDLYYRLAVFPLHIIPLRQRKQDIVLLARHFLSRLAPGHPGFSPEAVRQMEAYAWPGNVRELENWVEYAVVLSGNEKIFPEHLPSAMGQLSQNPLSNLALDFPSKDELERRYIDLVLEHTNGNKTEASKILGMSISTLWRRLKEIEEPRLAAI